MQRQSTVSPIFALDKAGKKGLNWMWPQTVLSQTKGEQTSGWLKGHWLLFAEIQQR